MDPGADLAPVAGHLAADEEEGGGPDRLGLGVVRCCYGVEVRSSMHRRLRLGRGQFMGVAAWGRGDMRAGALSVWTSMIPSGLAGSSSVGAVSVVASSGSCSNWAMAMDRYGSLDGERGYG